MEQDEFTAVYRQFYRPLYVYALSLSGNRADAEDLVQSTFLKALLSYEGGGSLRYWLTRVLKNEYFNLWKKRNRLVDEGRFDFSLLREEDHTLEELIQDEERRLLLEAIMKLPVHYKEVLLDSIYFHLSDEEIGKSMGITKENVRQIRSRAKKQVMRLLEVEEHEGF
ncbi:RNA polymerase sigma factor [Hungatella hathewayi]